LRHQKLFAIWNLDIGIYLLFGDWILEFASPALETEFLSIGALNLFACPAERTGYLEIDPSTGSGQGIWN